MKHTFRAWDEQAKEMHFNFQWIDSGTDGNDWIIFRSNRQELSKKPHPFENPYFRKQYHIMQFTGLKDKNGKEIYEGDIVNTATMYHGKPSEQKFKSKIVYNEHVARYQISYLNINDVFITDNIGFSYELEVIGNIHENPELLNAD